MTNLRALLEGIDNHVRMGLSRRPEVIDKGDYFKISNLPGATRKWHKISDAVALIADLKSSTRLGQHKGVAATASIYEAATGGVARVCDEFAADYLAIRGDGSLAIFWGGRRFERALSAGLTIKTFSASYLVPRLRERWPDLPETGLKVGIASSDLLVKRVGPVRNDCQEPVWAGKAVNYAAKAEQQADRHELIVTGSVWNWASGNDYLSVPCPCRQPTTAMWADVVIEKLPEGDGDRAGKVLLDGWCPVHGPDYCSAILAGKAVRLDIPRPVPDAPAAWAPRRGLVIPRRPGRVRDRSRAGSGS